MGGLNKRKIISAFSGLVTHVFLSLILGLLVVGQCQASGDIQGVWKRDRSYGQYLERAPVAERPDLEIVVPMTRFSLKVPSTPDVVVDWEFPEASGPVVITGEQSVVQWDVFVPEAGLYNLALEYYPMVGRGSAIEREIIINGEKPFEDAGYLSFSRMWSDSSSIRRDKLGNEVRPAQEENPEWREVILTDSRGYEQEPYLFYFKAGINTIGFVSLKEPMAIRSVRLLQYKQPPNYQNWFAQFAHHERLNPTENVLVKIQGEASVLRSDSTLFAIADQGDPTVEPYHVAEIRLNTVGGQRWNRAGQWLRWEFDVPESGLYKIAIKGKQNIRRGTYSNRKVRINGKVPFLEAEAVAFPYSNRYQMHLLGGDEPFLFYLEAGKNFLELEAVLGDLAELMKVTEETLYQLNTIYRRIVMITSANPDPIRDYQLEERIPDTLEEMKIQADVLEELANGLEDYTGQKGGHVLVLRNLARQLNDMAADPDTIARRLGEYRDNIGALGTWILETMEQPLQIDYIVVASPGQELPRAEPTAMESLGHELRKLLASFSHQYNVVGEFEDSTTVNRKPLKVWVGTGRDQAQSLRIMIDDSFTPQTGIPVSLELVNMNVLLAATLAGKGPDVALGVDPSLPINYGLRGAVLDLSKFEGFDDVASQFSKDAFIPYTFRDRVYGLPEQQPFPMLFYRKDILSEKGLAVPQTWDDVFKMIPELQKDNMNFGLPFTSVSRDSGGNIGDAPAGAGSLSASQGVTTFLMFLNQKGEWLFQEDAVATNLDTKAAVEAFTMWTDLYELYNLPVEYSQENRFRLGEMPVMIAPYTLYNVLTVFAPELRGEWDFTTVPGTVQPDGTIDRTAPGVGLACVMLNNTQDKEAAWEFLKWWSDAQTQARYGWELESIMGPAARYPTANLEALAQLPWTVREYETLMDQWQWITGIPEVPGGYMVGRHLDNAFRRVIFQHEPARETILDYNRLMNEELMEKRRELGIDGGI